PGMSGSSLACISTTRSAESSRFMSSGLRRREVVVMTVRIAGECGVRNAECGVTLSPHDLPPVIFSSRSAHQMGIYLGIDIGTSGTKTLAINENGKILEEASQEYPCYYSQPLWSEQDPEDWWKATVATIQAVVKKAKLKAADVKAIGLS